MFQFLTEYSLWFAIPAILIGLGYAYLLYSKAFTWHKNINRLLFGVRWLLVTLLCLLLLGPFTKILQNTAENPIVVLAIDNSESLPLVKGKEISENIKQKLTQLANQLREKDFEVQIQTFDRSLQPDSLKNLEFDAKKTDLSGMLRNIQASYENKNLASVVLLSDGIYNQGFSPNYVPYNIPINTVGVGDSIPQVDLNLRSAYANKIAYLGNKFPIVAEVYNTGFAGKSAQVRLTKNGVLLDSKNIKFPSENGFQTVEFLTSSDKKGMQRFVIQVVPLAEEFTKKNNVRNVYIDILDAREKILLVANSPHPDIKAIRTAVEKNTNYQFDVYIPQLSAWNTKKKINLDDKYDVVIFHQIPANSNISTNILNKFLAKKTPIWFVAGSQTNYRNLSNLNEAVSTSVSRQVDLVTPLFNPQFNKFTFSDENKDIITKYPPVNVPFGKFNLKGGAETVLYQQVGSVGTDKPLLVIGEKNGTKQAILLGENIWKWRLHEYSLNQNQNAFDELIGKTIQYLSTKEDKRRFRVYPISNEFSDSESVFFETEVYNKIYERVFGQKVELKITNEAGETNSYTYVNGSSNSQYKVSGLPQGVYKYVASAQIEGKTEISSGQFTIKALELEALNTTADFTLLRKLAKQSEGEFYNYENWSALSAQFTATQFPKIIHTQEQFEELMNLHWLMAILILLAGFEWFMRKFKGGY